MLSHRLGPAEVRFTGRAEGDLSSHAGPDRDVRQRAVADRPWRTATQVHGCDVVVVDGQRPWHAVEADALVTADPAVAVAIRTADCAPVALAGGAVAAVAHAGWRGLAAGVLERTLAEMHGLGATAVEAALGPCIHAECYEFGRAELDLLVDRFGDGVRATTANGSLALDLRAAVRRALSDLGVPLVYDADVCTACAKHDYWSHRARGEAQRQATVVWLA